MMTIDRRAALIGGAIAAAAGFASRAGAQLAATDKTLIDQVLRTAVDTHQVPGVVALAANDKGVIYQGAFGKRAVGQGAEMTLDSVFWIASMTKAITSTAAMQLVEQGKLQLDEPIGELLPELKSPQVLEGFDPSGAPKLRPAKRPITLRLLLTHTAGFTYDIWNANTGRYEKQAGIPGIITCKNDALRTPLAFDPGERWEYGINIDWVGKAVEKVSGQKLGDYFRDHIFNPLGMQDTSFKLSDSQRSRLVTMSARQADGSLKPIDFEMPQDPEFQMGGGGLYSTGPNYLKFVQVFLNDGGLNGVQLLRPETVKQMGQNQIGDIDVTVLKTVDPASSKDAEFFPGIVKKWGLGFMINTKEAPTGRSAGSLAWAGLANTYFWIDPKRRVGGVILMQLLPFGDEKALDVFSGYETAIYKMLQSA
jgi:methyl acetate hydrolase